MVTRLAPKIALTAVAAVALYVPALGSPLQDSCTWTAAVAGAAPTPSPSCGGDLRECLRQSADMHQTTFGGRYVTAEDVARCMEAFDACANGGASAGGNAAPPGSTPGSSRTPDSDSRSGSADSAVLPTRFTLEGLGPGVYFDCTNAAGAVSCSASGEPETRVSTISYTAEVTGTLSGLTMTGTATEDHSYDPEGSSGCVVAVHKSGPITYVFKPDGTALETWGPVHHQSANSGSCGGSSDNTYSNPERPVSWSALG